jgi:hypothetical protein
MPDLDGLGLRFRADGPISGLILAAVLAFIRSGIGSLKSLLDLGLYLVASRKLSLRAIHFHFDNESEFHALTFLAEKGNTCD